MKTIAQNSVARMYFQLIILMAQYGCCEFLMTYPNEFNENGYLGLGFLITNLT